MLRRAYISAFSHEAEAQGVGDVRRRPQVRRWSGPTAGGHREAGIAAEGGGRILMSYRNAWGYLRELEAAAGFKFVERAPGGGPRRGMRLTRAGKRFLERYRKFQNGLEGAMKRQFDRSFD